MHEDTYNATNDQKPHHHHHDFAESHCIPSLIALVIHHGQAKIFQTDVKVENGADTDWAEEAHNASLMPMVDLMDVRVHQSNDRRATEEKNEDT